MKHDQLKKFKSADWAFIKTEIIRYAGKKAAKKRWNSSSMAKGAEPADIALQAIEKTLNGIFEEDSELGQRNWNEKLNPNILDHLKDVIDSDLSNLVQSEEHKSTNYSTSLSDNDASEVITSHIDKTLITLSPEQILIAEEEERADQKSYEVVMKQLYRELEKDDEAVLLLMTFEELAKTDGPVKPQVAASQLKIDIKSVRNTMKRIATASKKVKGL